MCLFQASIIFPSVATATLHKPRMILNKIALTYIEKDNILATRDSGIDVVAPIEYVDALIAETCGAATEKCISVATISWTALLHLDA